MERSGESSLSCNKSFLTVLTNLPEEQCNDYGALSAALGNRFGNTHQVELNASLQQNEEGGEFARACRRH